MSSNILWSDTQGVPQLKEPFLAYYIEPYTRRFSDWMLGLTNDSSLDSRFGNFEPKNLISILNREPTIDGKTFDIELDKKELERLKELEAELKKRANNLYKLLKCNNFEGFYNLWKYGNKTSIEDEKKYWINKHLNLLVGQTQHLATSKNFTLIEELLELVAIELQSEEYEGLSSEQKLKIKRMLVDEDKLQILDHVHTRWGDKEIFIPTKLATGNYPKDKEFSDLLLSIFQEKAEKDIAGANYQILEEALNNILKKLDNNNINKKGKPYKTIDSAFVELKFTQATKKGKKYIINNAVNQFMKFFKKARTVGFSTRDMDAWKNYNKNNKGDKMIKESFLILLNDFFKTEKKIQSFLTSMNDLQKNPLNSANLMGFFGEVYTHGKSFFNLSSIDNRVNVYSTGRLLDTINEEQLNYDTVLVVDNQKFGIQTKNPYQTEKGYYKTYDQKFTLDSDYLYKLYLKTDDDTFKENFQQLNLNINNTTNPIALKKNIEAFLYNFAPNFLRLQEQKTSKNQFQELTDEIDDIIDTPIQNIFFVVRGEIIESATIVSELIKQYESFIKQINNVKRTWQITYRNDIKPNKYDYNKEEGLSYNPNYVKSKNLLKDISIHTAMNIKIPSMEGIKRLKL